MLLLSKLGSAPVSPCSSVNRRGSAAQAVPCSYISNTRQSITSRAAAGAVVPAAEGYGVTADGGSTSRGSAGRTSAAATDTAAAAGADSIEQIVQPVYPVLPAGEEAHFEACNTVFVEEFKIRGSEAGPDQRANIITIANLLQEVGGNHGVAMWGRSSTGFASMPGMDHLIFVATRMQIRMEEYPMW